MFLLRVQKKTQYCFVSTETSECSSRNVECWFDSPVDFFSAKVQIFYAHIIFPKKYNLIVSSEKTTLLPKCSYGKGITIFSQACRNYLAENPKSFWSKSNGILLKIRKKIENFFFQKIIFVLLKVHLEKRNAAFLTWPIFVAKSQKVFCSELDSFQFFKKKVLKFFSWTGWCIFETLPRVLRQKSNSSSHKVQEKKYFFEFESRRMQFWQPRQMFSRKSKRNCSNS